MREAALPLWLDAGFDPSTGGFREGLTLDGRPFDPFRRTRVQARQAYVFATVSESPQSRAFQVARTGLDNLIHRGRRDDGLYVARLGVDGRVLDETAYLYEQAFVLLGLAAVARADPKDSWARGEALALRSALTRLRHPAGGFREAGDRPFQANAHMHLLEAALAWEEIEPHAGWSSLADEVVELALERFIDRERGVLNEFFDEDWRPLGSDEGLLEPGHHFEWAWLLSCWSARRGEVVGAQLAGRLYETGVVGAHPSLGVTVNALWPDLSARDAAARLWPQTERLRSALQFQRYGDAVTAEMALRRYVDTPVRGVWRDQLHADGCFAPGHAPATSLYHLLGAVLALETLLR